jgi:hypothetical protein
MNIPRTLLVFLLTLSPIALGASDAPRPGDIDPARVVQHVPGMPERGRTMEAVRSRLGDPQRVLGPVGEPPITRWVYDRFTVYFEHERVLHSVKHRDR